MIERLRRGPDSERREAFGILVDGYWKPVYKHLRLSWHLTHQDAQDLTQTFFSDAFQKEWLSRYDPDRARFRTFVRVCVDRFAMNWQQAASRLKRGGGVETIHLDFAGAERELVPDAAQAADAEGLFRREFIRALFERAVAAVRAEYGAAGRTAHLAVFDCYDLDPADGVSYAQVASQLGLTTVQVTNYLAQVRRSFRQHALSALEGLTGSREEFRREARELFGLELE